MADSAAEAIANLRNREFKKEDSIKAKHEVYKRPKETKQVKFNLTGEVFMALFKKHAPANYKFNKENQKIIFTIFRYFLKMKNFNEFGVISNNASLDKGLLVWGNYGVGKTQLFEILHKVGEELVKKRNCFDVWFNIISAGSFVDDYMQATKDDSSNFNIESFYTGKLLIDDLGFEKKAFNKTELLGQVLFERERRNQITFVNSNHKPSELSARYGERIGDRIPKMFNIIKWEGESFRHE